MATVFTLPPPSVHTSAMASRRVPLGNVPNAINSPFRNIAAASGKRTRAQAGENHDSVYGQPPAKKQIVEVRDDDENTAPRSRMAPAQDVEGSVFAKRAGHVPPTAFERKLAAARERKQPSAKPEERNKPDISVENIRQWQRHYRRQFPQFVIYYDSIPEDVRIKTLKQVHALGAKEEKFFSKNATHVITSRPIPAELTSTSPDDEARYERTQPSAASRSAEPASLTLDQRRSTNALDANLQRRAQSNTAQAIYDIDPRKHQASGADVLSRARDLGIKIWALEKFHRMLHALSEDQLSGEPLQPHKTRSTTHTATKHGNAADLEQLLRNEKINGPADRDMTVAAQDMCLFRGCFIYVHDMNEQTRPVLVRDYPKPANKEQGKWPQFRLTAPGRCPFIEDPTHTKRLQEQERKIAQQEQAATQRKTRASLALETAILQPAPRVLAECQPNLRRSPRKLAQEAKAEMAKPLDPPKALPPKKQPSVDGMPPLFGSAQASLRGLPRFVGGEPVASGIQQSNITSAIRSQAISSAAISSTAPGLHRRAVPTKDLATLKKKVLERGASAHSQQSVPSSYLNDVRAAINNDRAPPPRAAKSKAMETLGAIVEDGEGHRETRPARPPARRKEAAKKELKPGYCENCRDKFEDFDDHIQSRKHHKFAVSQDNWKDLDALLGELKRPHKQP